MGCGFIPSLALFCAPRSSSPAFQILAWPGLGLVLRANFRHLSVSPQIIDFSFSPKFWASLLQWDCACIDEGESGLGAGAGRGEQEKADGCSANGASPFALTGRGTLSLSQFLKAH